VTGAFKGINRCIFGDKSREDVWDVFILVLWRFFRYPESVLFFFPQLFIMPGSAFL
jgi:hypothetical protein